jgi:aerotaxis receptor
MNRPIKIKLVNEEVNFESDQLFFSITDKSGKIELSNDVFSEVCGYSKEELKGKPHNIIRHPDMPKYVFKILWESIQNGKPIGCYVKNLASNGKYYWVYALVLPVGQKYLSIRLKASKEQIELVENLYHQMIEAEIISDKAVLSILNNWLWSQQFPNYESWMCEVLHKEINDRLPSVWRYHFFGQEKPSLNFQGSDVNSLVIANIDQVWTNVQCLNKSFGSFYSKKEIADKNFKSFEKLLTEYYEVVLKLYNETFDNNKENKQKLANLTADGSSYIDLKDHITVINNVGKTCQFYVDTFHLHTKMLDLFFKNFFYSLNNKKIDYELIFETLDSILVLAKSIQYVIELFDQEQVRLESAIKKIIVFSVTRAKVDGASNEKLKSFHSHLKVNAEVITRGMTKLTREINESINDFLNSIESTKVAIMELKIA